MKTVVEKQRQVSYGILMVASVVILAWTPKVIGDENNDVVTDEKKVIEKRTVIEEVMVTAQRREQMLADVPVSISVISDEFIAEQAIADVGDVLVHTPNMQLQPRSGSFPAAGAAPICRGFSTDQTNRAFELPCGIAIDGVPYARGAYFGAALFDVRRVEVMRGPQGTTFGKNTTAGLVHLITKDPGEQFSGYFDVQHGEFGRRRIEAALGGPLVSEVVQFRIAAFKDDRDGYMRNTTAQVEPKAPEWPGVREGEGYRIKFGIPDLWGSELKLSYERADLESEGMITELFDVDPQMAAFFRRYDPNADFEKDNFINSSNEPTRDATVIDRYQLDWHYSIFEWGIDAIGGYSRMTNEAFMDGFSTPAPTNTVEQSEVNPVTTFEARVTSPTLSGLLGLDSVMGWQLGRSDFLAGVFYQASKLDPIWIGLVINRIPIGVYLAMERGEFPSAIPPESIETLPIEDLEELSGLEGSSESEWLNILYNEDRETKAGYMQLQWYFHSRWSLQLGMRYSEELKKASWEQTRSDPAPVLEAAGWQEYKEQRSIKETHFQPKVTLNFNPVDDINLFLRWGRGFKGGGFNTTQHRPDNPATPLSFGPEEVTEWAFDAKMALLSGAMRWNTTLYHMRLKNFQVLTLAARAGITDISLSPMVANAGEGVVWGVESDLMYRPTEWLTVISTLGVNDTEYKDFTFGACPWDEQERERCDNSGKPFQFAPKWSGTLTLAFRYPLAFWGLDSMNLTAGTTVEYYGSQFLHAALDERDKVSAFSELKVSVGIEDPGHGWSFRVIGENLTNENTPTRLDTTHPKFSAQDPKMPRAIFGQLRWSF